MTKLSNVVGGLLRDLAQSHAISDASTVEILDAYGRDDALSQLPVPRMSIRQAEIRLRFAVAEIQDEPAELGAEEVRDLWTAALQDRVLPAALLEVGRLDNKRVSAALHKAVAQGGLTAELDPALLLREDGEARVIKLSHAFLDKQIQTVAPSYRASLEGLDVSGALIRALRDEVPQLIDAVRQLDASRRAAAANLSVAITTESLASVPEAQISELVLTVSMDEVQRGSSPALGSGG